jgi:hypothetical protein
MLHLRSTAGVVDPVNGTYRVTFDISQFLRQGSITPRRKCYVSVRYFCAEANIQTVAGGASTVILTLNNTSVADGALVGTRVVNGVTIPDYRPQPAVLLYFNNNSTTVINRIVSTPQNTSGDDVYGVYLPSISDQITITLQREDFTLPSNWTSAVNWTLALGFDFFDNDDDLTPAIH